MGIIGFGRIGQAEGRIAKALGMNVIAYDLYPNESGRVIADYVTLDELFANSDVISLHCNLTPENTEMINRNNIAKMKDGVILLNNARGSLSMRQISQMPWHPERLLPQDLMLSQQSRSKPTIPFYPCQTVLSLHIFPGLRKRAAAGSWTARWRIFGHSSQESQSM